jgi:hypothetical protein
MEIIYCLPEHSRMIRTISHSLQSFTFKEKSKRISTTIGARFEITEYLCWLYTSLRGTKQSHKHFYISFILSFGDFWAQ